MKRILLGLLFAVPCLAQYGPPPLSFPSGPTLPTSCNGAQVFGLISGNTTTPYYCSGGVFVTFGSGAVTGTIVASPQYQIPFYSAAGTSNTLTGMGIVNNAVVVTNGSGVPSESTTLPTGLTIPGSKIINGISYSDAYPGSTLDVRANACLQDALNRTGGNTSGLCSAQNETGIQNVAATIVEGTSASTSGSAPEVGFILPCNGIWQGTMTNSTPVILSYAYTSMYNACPGAGVDGNLSIGAITGSTPNYIWEVVGNSNGYITASGFHIQAYGSGNVGTTTGTSVYITGGFDDGSTISHVLVIDNKDSSPVVINDVCCSFTWENSSINAGWVGTPLTLQTSNSGGTKGFIYSNGSIVHPGNGKHNVVCTDTSTDGSETKSDVYFDQVYTETQDGDATTSEYYNNGCYLMSVHHALLAAYTTNAANPIVERAAGQVDVSDVQLSNGADTWVLPNAAVVKDDVTSINYPSDSTGHFGIYSISGVNGVLVTNTGSPSNFLNQAGAYTSLTQYYQTVQVASSALPQEPIVNYLSNMSCVDDPGTTSTNCTPTSGFANPMTALGDTIYGGASGAATRLAGQTATGPYMLTESPSGSAVAPAWIAYGTAALVNTGTSGGTIGLLNGANTYSGADTFSGLATFSNSPTGSAPGTLFSGTPTTSSLYYPVVAIDTVGATAPTRNASGTMLEINAPSGFSGTLSSWLVNGTSVASLTSSGTLTVGNVGEGSTGRYAWNSDTLLCRAGMAGAIAAETASNCTNTTAGANGALWAGTLNANTALTTPLVDTTTNCSSSASPAVCAAAPAGSAALPTNAVSSSIQINTTAVTANSQIFVMTDDTLSTKLGVTCNSTVATLVGGLTVSARSAGASFTVSNNVAVVTNPLCISWFIVN